MSRVPTACRSILLTVLLVISVPSVMATKDALPGMARDARGTADDPEGSAESKRAEAERSAAREVQKVDDQVRPVVSSGIDDVQAVVKEAERDSKAVYTPVLQLADAGAKALAHEFDAFLRLAEKTAEDTIEAAHTLISNLQSGESRAEDGGSQATQGAPVTTSPGTSAMVVLAWAAASTGAAVAVAVLGRRLVIVTILPLLSRISHSELYNNEARRTIHDLVVAEPGFCLNEIVTRTGYSRNAVSYHLFVLEKEEEIVSIKDGKYRRYFTRNGKYVNGAKDVVAALRNETTLQLARTVVENPGAIQRDLCIRLGTTPSATCWHANRLLDLGVIRKERRANTVQYFPGEMLAKYDFSDFGIRIQAPALPAPAAPAAP